MLIKLWKICKRRLVCQASTLLLAIRDPRYADYSPYQSEPMSLIDSWAPDSIVLRRDVSERIPVHAAETEQVQEVQEKNFHVSDDKPSHTTANALEEELLFYFRGIPASVQPTAMLAIKALHDMLREGSEPRVFKGIKKTPDPSDP